ncbi:MAG: hypothetical protein LBU43_04720 [Candidatus Accumulibacter sp.]|nr:hypothetical protein [Accumulibacter sp.]
MKVHTENEFSALPRGDEIIAIYSKIISDQNIVDCIQMTFANILIVACGGCVNESLAYDNNMPILVGDSQYASKLDAERISKLLSANGHSVQVKVIEGDMPVLCIHEKDCLLKLSNNLIVFT